MARPLNSPDDIDYANVDMKAYIDAQLIKMLNAKLDEIERRAEDAIINGDDD